MYITTLFTTAKIRKQPWCPLIDTQIGKDVMHTHNITSMKYYPAIKKKEILLSATIWMNLEGIMLSEIRQAKEGKCPVVSLIWGILINNQANKQNKKRLIETETKEIVTRREEWGGWVNRGRGI